MLLRSQIVRQQLTRQLGMPRDPVRPAAKIVCSLICLLYLLMYITTNNISDYVIDTAHSVFS